MTTEEKLEQEKQMVLSMKNAQANMKVALDRIQQLETALKRSCDLLDDVAKIHLIGAGYSYNSTKTVKDYYLELSAQCRKVL